MNKIFLIISREYLTRIRKRSFIVMSIIGPILFAAMFVIPIWVATRESDVVKNIAVIDSSKFLNKIPDSKYIKFYYQPGINITDYKKDWKKYKQYDAVLFIPNIIINVPSSVQLISNEQLNIGLITHIASALEKDLTEQKLQSYGIKDLDQIIESSKTKVNIQTINITETGEKESDVGVNMGLGYMLGLLIYMFIFMFGAQVMRGVIEEKTNRIVEIIISSVKPFQLMMGKVLGIALVVLTQISFWIIMTAILVTFAKLVFMPDVDISQIQANSQSVMSPAGSVSNTQTATPSMNISETQKAFQKIDAIPFVKIIGWFIFFFIGGYLLYGSFFAAIGSVVDTETDTQQFMLPITIPLILGLFVMFYTLNNHDSSIAFWFSMIPLTSPIVMMARIPFGAPNSEIILSAIILIVTFIGAIWVAGKIYRTGILIYGKKIGYKEIYKWIKYKH